MFLTYRQRIAFMLIPALLLPVAGTTQTTQVAVNHVVLTADLHTSGQPTADELSQLIDHGFELVINLAPPTSQGAIAAEGQLVAENGITYVNIPVDWLTPTYADFSLFSGVLNESDGRQVLVHCQINKRASIFAFLYQAIHQDIPVEVAFEDVRKIWVPEDQWVAFGTDVLERHGIDAGILTTP